MDTPNILWLDIETRSRVDLKKSNVYRYVEDPDFKILMCAWSLNDSPVEIVTDQEDIRDIPGLLDPETIIVAHNAAFERICFSQFAGLPVGEYLPASRFICTMALAALGGYPRKLEDLAKGLGVAAKDAAGTVLINFFCKPNRKGEFNSPEDNPEKWQQFLDYCVQDVIVLREVHRVLDDKGLFDLTPMEREIYNVDQKINDGGAEVDLEMAELAVEASDNNRMIQELRISEISGIHNPGSGPQMTEWLASKGVKTPNLQKDTVTKLLKEATDPVVREVLELRQEIALVAAKKYTAATDRLNSDDRLRGTFQYFGAHTGRWSGRGVQLQNLPSASLDKDHEQPDLLIANTILDLKLTGEADANTLKALVRSMFVGPFTVVDYAAIEARVLAWLAGEKWALEAFRAGRDIYVETAERMGQGMTRKEGKVAVLALGYNGGTGSLEAMGAEGSEEQLRFLVNQWRDANTRITAMWPIMEESFKHGGSVGKYITIRKDKRDRIVVLPSGREIIYHDVRGRREIDQWGRDRLRLSYLDPQVPGYRKDTYGGRLTENVTQAVARDILAEAMVRLDKQGYEIALHVHDEIGVAGTHPIDVISQIMSVDPGWAKGLPLDAEGYHCPRYRKD